MMNVIKKPGDETIELTYDLYPSDRRPDVTSWATIDRQLKHIMSDDSTQTGPDRRNLTYDYYPGNRRRTRNKALLSSYKF